MVLQVQTHRSWEEVKDHLLWPAGNTPVDAAHNNISLFLLQDHTAGLHSPWGLPASSGPFLPNYFPAARLFPTTYRTLHSPLLNLMILLAHFSSLSGPVWMAAQPSFSSPSFVASSAHLLMRTCSIPPSRLLTQILNRNSLRTDPQSIPLVTGLQARLCATYHHPLGLAVQAVFNPLVVCSSRPCSSASLWGSYRKQWQKPSNEVRTICITFLLSTRPAIPIQRITLVKHHFPPPTPPPPTNPWWLLLITQDLCSP